MTTRGRLASLFLLAMVGVITVGASATAASAEEITSFTSDIEIEPTDGAVLVTETIRYDFGSTPHHGIDRALPVRVSYDSSRDRVFPLEVVRVTASPGTPHPYEVKTDGNGKRIRIGDPGITITGVHTYTITYRMAGVLNDLGDHGEFVWNVTGSDWDVSISSVRATVTVPGGATRVRCATGPVGSQAPCTEATLEDGVGHFVELAVLPSEDMTVTVAFPSDAVAMPPPDLADKRDFAHVFALTSFSVSAAVLILGGAIVVAIMFVRRFGTDYQYAGGATAAAFGGVGFQVEPATRGEIPVQFEPPDKLPPGLIGALVHEGAGKDDVSATIVDLATRGYLRIEQVEDKGLSHGADWRIVDLNGSGDGLRPYELKVLAAIFADSDSPLVSDLQTDTTFGTTMREMPRDITSELVTEGWYTRKPSTTRLLWKVPGYAILVGGVILTVILAGRNHDGIVGVATILAGVVLLVAARWMPSRTAKGRAVYVRTKGFERFINESERDRAQFAERANLFTQYLPYAVAFGATKKWANAFRDVAGVDTTTAGWYVGTGPFDAGGFADGIGSFSGSFSAMSASSGSGFSSGGGSGGGGGGGGGGSW